MPRGDNDIRVIPSVLDRLLDDEPEVSSEPAVSRAKSLRQMKDSVRRDLQWLLNSRQSAPHLLGGRGQEGDARAADGRELRNSLVFFGLPDFSSASVFNKQDQNRIRHALKAAIEKFEPRLLGVEVELLPPREEDRKLHFRIDARLRVEPAPEPVTFDTVLNVHNGEYRIEAH